MTRAAALALLLLLGGCRGSGIPWTTFEVELEAGSEAVVRVEGSAPLGWHGETELRVKGPAKLHAARDGAVKVEEPKGP